MKHIKQFIIEKLHYNFDMQFPNILEMAQINHDTDGPFNKNKMKIQIYGGSTEHNPPHVHIMDRSRTFDIRVSIEDGELISIKKDNKRVNFNEICGQFQLWLKKYSVDKGFKDKSNKEMCVYVWNLCNPDKMIEYIENEE